MKASFGPAFKSPDVPGSSAKNQAIRHYCTTTGPSVVGSVPVLEKLPGSVPVSVTLMIHTDLMREVMPRERDMRQQGFRFPKRLEPRNRGIGELKQMVQLSITATSQEVLPGQNISIFVNNQPVPKLLKFVWKPTKPL